MVVPRPGVAAEVEIGLVGAGDIEGVLVKNDGSGFEGLDVELVDAAGKVVATARSDYDGFFLFERVAYGHYRFRLTAESAEAAGVERAIDRDGRDQRRQHGRPPRRDPRPQDRPQLRIAGPAGAGNEPPR